jgi:hypothetical protein
VHDPNGNSLDARMDAAGEPIVRVVLAEPDAPGSLHYLLESEGFLVIGSASDDRELARVLQPGLHPDVVVLDADTGVTSALIARDQAPSAHVIVVWPDGVQPIPGTERIAPRAMYEQLGPSIRRAVHERPQPQATTPDPLSQEPPPYRDAPLTVAAGASPPRRTHRVWVTPVVLVGVLALAMGAAIALPGLHLRVPWAAGRTGVATPRAASSDVLTPTIAVDRPSRGPDATTSPRSCRPGDDRVGRRPHGRASAGLAAAHARACETRGGSHGKPDHPGKGRHPGKPDHPGKKPDGVGHTGSSHDQSGTSNGQPGGASHDPGPPQPHGPDSPRGSAEHGSR